MQRATPWFVGPAIHGARAAQLFLRSRAHSRERARCAHTGAQQIDAQRSRLIAHSLSRLECRLPLKANKTCPLVLSVPYKARSSSTPAISADCTRHEAPEARGMKAECGKSPSPS